MSRFGFLNRFSYWMKRLAKDERGNVVVFFAFSIIPMLTAMGIAIDVTSMYMTRSKLQGALDAGALAGAQAYFSSSLADEVARTAATKTMAENYMLANVPELAKDGFVPTINLTVLGDNQLQFTADVAVKTSFTKFLGYDEFNVDVLSVVSAGQAQVTEIVLALDNTSSMFWGGGRFVLMRDAAKDFTTKMFNQAADPTLLKISVVPWAATVNIKSERAAAPSSTPITLSSMDAAGSGLVPVAPFNSRLTYVKHPDTGAPFFSNAQINTLFAPVEWRGCIRAADNERRVSSSGVIQDTLTDGPPAIMRWPASYLDYRFDTAGRSKKSNCRREPRPHTHGNNNNNDDDDDDGGPTGPGGTQASIDGAQFASDLQKTMAFVSGDKTAHNATREVCDWEWVPVNGGGVPWCDSWGDNGINNAYWPTDQPCSNNGNVANKTKKACVSDPNEFAYFANGGDACDWEDEDDIFPWDEHKPIYGPNLNCPTAMLPLSSNRRQVIRKLDHMYPVPGGTHADIGLMWALRALSPRTSWNTFWGATTEQAPMAFNSESGRKIVILLTDGENVEASDYEGYWGCSRKNRPGGVGNCWEPGSAKDMPDDVLDDLMLHNCTVMKDTYGIELYTIAVDINSPDSIGLLRDCASSPEHAFNITGAQLSNTFEELAQTNLRIIK